MELLPGNVFNIEAQRQALRNLDSLSLFSNIKVHPLPDEKQEGGIVVKILSYSGFNPTWGVRGSFPLRSKEYQVTHISKSVFVTNFPENFESNDLWKICEGYGKVVDVYIPNRKSKEGKRFAFIRFIKVGDMDRLIGNLCTIWIGQFHPHANVVRYERPRIPSPTAGHGFVNNHAPFGSYASIAKDNSPLKTHVFQASTVPALVLDDSCVIDRDLSRHVMGRVKYFNSIPNLRTTLAKEGFSKVKLTYLGVLWVMIELDNEVTMQKLLQHIRVKSWFHVLQAAKPDFVSEERIVWVDIEGILLNLWTRETFSKIGAKWGEALDLKETSDLLFARKRMCIKTKQAYNILEKFKVILKGKVFLVRAKELFTWTPTFLDCKESEYYSDNESLQGENLKHVGSQDGLQDLDVDSDVEGVSETVFGDKNSSPNNTFCRHNDKEVEQQSEDPFNLYDLLKQNPKGVALYTISSSHKIYPHCFYPGENIKKGDEINLGYDKVNLSDSSSSFSHPPGFTPVDLDPCQENIPTGDVHKNGSDKVGQSMGYAMEGCLKDFEHIIGSQGVDDVPQ
ncbi:RNA-directed DNA polymerase, eukaryota [Tanacetum coccineum]